MNAPTRIPDFARRSAALVAGAWLVLAAPAAFALDVCVETLGDLVDGLHAALSPQADGTVTLRLVAQTYAWNGAETVVLANRLNLLGGYAEISYDVLQCLMPETEKTLEPFFRFEYLNTQWNMPSGFAADDSNQLQIYTAGIQFKPIPNVVLKADYRNKVADSGSSADEINLGFGLAF